MPTAYYAPGVYIEEADSGPKPIQGVATSVTAFIGFTKKAEKFNDDGITTRSILGEPILVTSWAQFEKHFGGYDENAYLPYSVRGFFDNGGGRCYVTSVRTSEAHQAQALLNVLYKKDLNDPKEAGKEIPGLVVLAKKAGTAGNDVQIKVSAAPPAAAAGDALTTDPRERKKLFQIAVRANAHSDYVPLKNVAQKAKARAAIDEAKRQAAQAKQQATIAKPDEADASKRQSRDQKNSEMAALKQKWEQAGIDLSTTNNQWEQVKAEWLKKPENAPRGAEVDQARQQYNTLKTDVQKLDNELNKASAKAAGPTPNTGEVEWDERLQAAEAARENWAFALEDLPFWGESGRKDQQNLADGQSDDVQVWRLYKRGREAESQPVATKEDRKLDGGMLNIDHFFLQQKQLITDKEFEIAVNDNGQALFKEKSTALYQGDEAKRKGIDGLYAYDDINLICAPDVMMAYKVTEDKDTADNIVKSIQEALLTFCKRAHYPFAILDAPPNKDVQAINAWRMNLPGGDTMYGALYYPWLKIADPFNAGRQLEIPPSGHLAGIYARSDGQRGVHKAPANEIVSGALDLTVNVTKAEQELLNPNGINCIRQFPGRGIRVWGARTLSMTDPAWRYINVRRLFSYVEASVERSTQWVVFEPNDFMLWAKVRRDVTAFLRTVWLSGALFGLTPEQSFYVKCDEETNPRELRDLGQMVCEIGLAPVKPAEFVIFRFSQWAGQEA